MGSPLTLRLCVATDFAVREPRQARKDAIANARTRRDKREKKRAMRPEASSASSSVADSSTDDEKSPPIARKIWPRVKRFEISPIPSWEICFLPLGDRQLFELLSRECVDESVRICVGKGRADAKNKEHDLPHLKQDLGHISKKNTRGSYYKARTSLFFFFAFHRFNHTHRFCCPILPTPNASAARFNHHQTPTWKLAWEMTHSRQNTTIRLWHGSM